MDKRSVFFSNLRAEIVRKYGCGDHLGWVNILANAMGWSFEKTKAVIFRYEFFEPQQMLVPYQVANSLNLPVDRIVYDPKNADRDSYYWKSADHVATKAYHAENKQEEMFETLQEVRRDFFALKDKYKALRTRFGIEDEADDE